MAIEPPISLQLLKAGSEEHITAVKQLFIEYAKSLDFDLCFQGFDQELAGLPGKYSQPSGCIILALLEGTTAGCVALRPLPDHDSVCEMKRLYVRPNCQGKSIGRQLVKAIIEEARKLGYKSMRLDTVPSMQTAITLYKSFGFVEIEPYRENPVSGTLYLELDLDRA